jgi:hypothetical protein
VACWTWRSSWPDLTVRTAAGSGGPGRGADGGR